jgi:hypothetical protein
VCDSSTMSAFSSSMKLRKTLVRASGRMGGNHCWTASMLIANSFSNVLSAESRTEAMVCRRKGHRRGTSFASGCADDCFTWPSERLRTEEKE